MTPTTSLFVKVTVNGERYEREVPARRLLVHFLRDDLDLTGTHIGCDTGSCGACTVHLDGVPVKSCSVLAAQVDGASITTVEGLAGDEQTPLQRSFAEHHALQCGYCTPGMLMSATALLEQNPPRPRTRSGRAPGQHLPLYGLLEHRRSGRGRRGGRERVTDRRDRGHETTSEGLRRSERSAQGGPPAGRGPGRLLRRRQAPRHGLPALRAVALPARPDPLDRRLGGARAAGRIRHADGRRGRDPHRPVLPDRGGARRQHQGLRARRRQGALRR